VGGEEGVGHDAGGRGCRTTTQAPAAPSCRCPYYTWGEAPCTARAHTTQNHRQGYTGGRCAEEGLGDRTPHG
jgi:hypothetical protein